MAVIKGTLLLQRLDISISKPFKVSLRQCHEAHGCKKTYTKRGNMQHGLLAQMFE